MEYVPIIRVLSSPREGVEVAIRGWVYRKRELKTGVFLLIRDSTGVIQAVAKPEDKTLFEKAAELGIESSVKLRGVVKLDKRAPGGVELHITSLEPVHVNSVFPITKDASPEYLLDVRHLWLRSRKMNAVLKIRHTVFGAIHEYFRSRGFYEVQCPSFITAACEGGATLFTVDYFGKKNVYLTQSAQFYLEALIFSLEKVYTIAPSFRAEKSRTRRHLTEFWHAEAEVAWCGLEEIMKIEEELVTYIVRKVLDKRLEELSFLKRDIKPLENVKPPFYRITYDEALEIINKKGFKIEWGEDFGADEERALTREFDKPVFVYGYPEQCKAFYHKNDPKRPEVTLSADLLAPEGYGEIIGGGERIADEEELIRKIKRFGLRVEDYEWYIDLRRYGSVPHAGFGLGVDRTVMWVAGLDHIVNAIPFPRTIRRVYP
ncbi:MAG: asparagine--tRNA ligase [Thermoprotei archaeon]|nr:MAG: asparagine--tRNA ligase [Thermoprotei archaeon]